MFSEFRKHVGMVGDFLKSHTKDIANKMLDTGKKELNKKVKDFVKDGGDLALGKANSMLSAAPVPIKKATTTEDNCVSPDAIYRDGAAFEKNLKTQVNDLGGLKAKSPADALALVGKLMGLVGEVQKFSETRNKARRNKGKTRYYR